MKHVWQKQASLSWLKSPQMLNWQGLTQLWIRQAGDHQSYLGYIFLLVIGLNWVIVWLKLQLGDKDEQCFT